MMNTFKHSLRLRLAVILVGMTAGTVIIGVLINNTFLGNYYMSTKQEELTDMYNTINDIFIIDNQTNEIMAKRDDIQRLRTRCYNLGIQMIVVDTSYGIRFANVPSNDMSDSELKLGLAGIVSEIIERIDNYEKNV